MTHWVRLLAQVYLNASALVESLLSSLLLITSELRVRLDNNRLAPGAAIVQFGTVRQLPMLNFKSMRTQSKQ